VTTPTVRATEVLTGGLRTTEQTPTTGKKKERVKTGEVEKVCPDSGLSWPWLLFCVAVPSEAQYSRVTGADTVLLLKHSHCLGSFS
jgi:hypothetical protein